jgi:uncharacterized protein YhdP
MRVLIGRLSRLLAWTVFALLVLTAAGLSALRMLLRSWTSGRSRWRRWSARRSDTRCSSPT